MECKFCKNKFSTKYTLAYHQKNNKSCLSIQVKETDTIEIQLKNCEFCHKSFSVKNLKTHLQTCKKKKQFDVEEKIRKDIKGEYETKMEEIKGEFETKMEEIIEDMKEENQKLKDYIIKLETKSEIYSKDHDELIKIAKQPKNVKTNITNTSTTNFLTDTEKVKKLLDTKYDRFVLAQGQKGIAKFAVENILTDDNGDLNYICVDPSRGIFKYQNDEGGFEKDVKAEKLTNLLFNSDLREKTRTLGMKIWTNEDGSHNNEKFGMYQPVVYEIEKMDSDNSAFRGKLACMTTGAVKKS